MSDRYSMVIRWSEEDLVFVVSLPEFGDYAQTHGCTYEEAARNGCEVLELLVESFQAEGRPLPAPQLFKGSCGELAGDKPCTI
ncbi:MAG: type II toxin-antitoxin system HicB family antitoxin [Gemmataceae bacterium]